MPELAEIKIMAEYINSTCANEDFTSISVSSEVVNRLGIVQPSELQVFSITAEARGKELILNLLSGQNKYRLSCAMGMSGHWTISDRDNPPKHTHLKFNAISKRSLCLVDARRFAKWKWTKSWNNKRGPCPLSDFDNFRNHININAHKRAFTKPIYEVLMNQSYFNGIGNYLRAEILYRLDINPFQSAWNVIVKLDKGEELLRLCHDVCQEAYLVGGGELKDWHNPFKTGYGRGRINEKMNKLADTSFREWLQCYGKMLSIDDNKSRRFWYNEKWAYYANI